MIDVSTVMFIYLPITVIGEVHAASLPVLLVCIQLNLKIPLVSHRPTPSLSSFLLQLAPLGSNCWPRTQVPRFTNQLFSPTRSQLSALLSLVASLPTELS